MGLCFFHYNNVPFQCSDCAFIYVQSDNALCMMSFWWRGTIPSIIRIVHRALCSALCSTRNVRCARYDRQPKTAMNGKLSLYIISILMNWKVWILILDPDFSFCQNLHWKLGQQSTICWNTLGLSRDYGLNWIFLGKIESWNFQCLFEK